MPVSLHARVAKIHLARAGITRRRDRSSGWNSITRTFVCALRCASAQFNFFPLSLSPPRPNRTIYDLTAGYLIARDAFRADDKMKKRSIAPCAPASRIGARKVRPIQISRTICCRLTTADFLSMARDGRRARHPVTSWSPVTDRDRDRKHSRSPNRHTHRMQKGVPGAAVYLSAFGSQRLPDYLDYRDQTIARLSLAIGVGGNGRGSISYLW